MINKPNIIYILADDMGYGDISYLNEKCPFETPNFDLMCKEGISFDDAHATSALCTPSRYGLLTGRYNWRSSLKTGVLGGYSKPLIEEGRKTVASLLKENGYKTACVGKWHLGMDWAHTGDFYEPLGFNAPENIDYTAPIKNSPNTYGFDYYFGISASLDMPPYVYIENNMVVEQPTHFTEDSGKAFWRKGPTAPHFKHKNVLPELTDKVIEKINEYKANPFFIYFPMPAPHTPILPTEEFIGKSKTNAYGDFVLMCDEMIRRINQHLKDMNLFDNTIVIFTADNGCSPSADFKELASKGHNPSYIFRGHKADIFEGGHRIPLLITWPKAIQGGRHCDDVVSLSDFTATVADILNVKLDDNMAEDSISNLPAWLNDDYKKPLREATVHHSDDGSLSIRQGKYKLEMCAGSGGWSYPAPSEYTSNMPTIQLYDLSNDIGETTNVYDKYPEIVEELKSLLIKYIKDGRSTPGLPQENTGEPVWTTIKWIKN